jgi:hypothetical protein
MMSGQPTTEQLVRKFVWCQFDVVGQRLSYIHNVRQAAGTSSGVEGVGQKLSIIQFHGTTSCKYDNMVRTKALTFYFIFLQIDLSKENLSLW